MSREVPSIHFSFQFIHLNTIYGIKFLYIVTFILTQYSIDGIASPPKSLDSNVADDALTTTLVSRISNHPCAKRPEPSIEFDEISGYDEIQMVAANILDSVKLPDYRSTKKINTTPTMRCIGC